MLLPGIVATTMMLAACAVIAADSSPTKALLYAFYRLQRRRRAG
jgi:hypothetical protein